MKKQILILVALVILLGGFLLINKGQTARHSARVTQTITQSPKQLTKETFSYTGHDGVDALTLLKEKTAVEQDSSGLVTSIHGRKADAQKHEYWAFYVNGKMASVGPKEYVTKNTDKIDWKVENY